MDTIVYLQRTMKVLPNNIYWIIPNDVWMLSRSKANPYSWSKALMKCNLDMDQAALLLEKQGEFLRLDTTIKPTKFRFPVIGSDEYKYLQKIPKSNLIRRGRVTSIDRCHNKGTIRVCFDNGEPWELLQQGADAVNKNITFVHCTSPGPFNNSKAADIFESDKVLNLAFIYAPPVPISMSTIAKIESSRVNQTLNIEFGKQLLKASDGTYGDGNLTDNDVLKLLFKGGYNILSTNNLNHHIEPLRLMALFLSLCDSSDTITTYQWMKANRLSMLSVPGFKANIYESMCYFATNYKQLGYTVSDAKIFELMADKLKSLEGK